MKISSSRRARIKNQVRALRRLRGLTQQQLARGLGYVDARSIRRLEAGEHCPGVRLIAELLVLLRVPFHQVFPEAMWDARERIRKRLGEGHPRAPNQKATSPADRTTSLSATSPDAAQRR